MWTPSKRAFSTFGRAPIPGGGGGGGGRNLLFTLPLAILPAAYGYFEYYWNNKQEDGTSKVAEPAEPDLKLNDHAPVKEFIAEAGEEFLRYREEAPKVAPVLKHKEETLRKGEEAPKMVPVPKFKEEQAKIEFANKDRLIN